MFDVMSTTFLKYSSFSPVAGVNNFHAVIVSTHGTDSSILVHCVVNESRDFSSCCENINFPGR